MVITGAAGGIGVALCDRMRADGYVAIGIDRVGVPAADIGFLLDLGEPERVATLGQQLSHEHELKAVIHNAAVQPLAGAGDTSISEWSETLKVNLLAVD
ncbi:SDR family NAD(P)-dependent oxidoreductase, partial [Mycolicibacterium sp.]|uniref:SDR family NAD(P)-dependent oxidoreductase n=1 Tax=Mycolicibacterium sp. TaxID=2320850 RepID=UPI0028AC412E